MENISFEKLPAAVSEMREMLLDIQEKLTDSFKRPEPDGWLTLEDLQSYHPDKPAKATIYGWIHKGSIPYHKGGKKLRFRKSEIDAWIDAGSRKVKREDGL
jgi:excisionase family DNA binding protein